MALTALVLAGGSPTLAGEPQRAGFRMQIAALDPAADSSLGAGNRLYVQLRYDSPVAVRFVPEAIRQGEVQASAETSNAPPYNSGHGEALAWLTLNAPLRIDELRITAYDIDWRPLGVLSTPAGITWETRDSFAERQPAEWVEPLLRQHRRVFDTTFDPQPEKPEPLFDLFFLLSFMAIPGYLLMQVQMLIRYRGQWQWYAAAPLLPIVPMGLYSLFGLGLSTAVWVIFLFRYMTLALLYLLILWAIRRCKVGKSPEENRHQPVDATAGTE